MSISLPRLFYASLRRPDPLPGDPGLLRVLAARPTIFAVLSTLLQWRDARRLSALGSRDAESSGEYQDVYDYNLGKTVHKAVTRTRRAERVIPLLTLPKRSLRDERVLLIGPRNIHELLQFWVAGFKWSNIEGIDLYSTNEKIKVMNMEAMTFADQTFDAIFSSATISYAKDMRKAVSEVIRVLKIGGRAAFSHSHVHGESEWSGNGVSGEAVIEMIEESGGEIYFKNINRKTIATGQSAEIYEIALVRRR